MGLAAGMGMGMRLPTWQKSVPAPIPVMVIQIVSHCDAAKYGCASCTLHPCFLLSPLVHAK